DRAPSLWPRRCGSSARPGPARMRSCRPRRWLPGPYGPCRFDGDRSLCDWRSCAHLLANFWFSNWGCGDAEHLVQAPAIAADVVHVEGAVDQTALAPGPDDPAHAEHPQVPRDARLAHVEVLRELVDVDLAGLGEPLEDAQAGGVGEGQEVVRKLVALTGEKHKGCFIEYTASPLPRPVHSTPRPPPLTPLPPATPPPTPPPPPPLAP